MHTSAGYSTVTILLLSSFFVIILDSLNLLHKTFREIKDDN